MVWVPAGTPPEHRRLLIGPIELRELPLPNIAAGQLGIGHFVVADFWRPDFTQMLRRLRDVRVVQAISAGVEDLAGRLPEGAVLCDGAGIHDAPVAEWVVMAILASRRHLAAHVLDQRAATWRHPGLAAGIDDIEGSTVLLVGYGSIARAVERRLAPFGVSFLRVGRKAREGVATPEALPALLPQADIVVILLPLTPDTDGFVGKHFIEAMRTGALLVNPSRGRIVDTAALTSALETGRIRAALDVTEPEPLPEDHRLWSLPEVLITPHVGGSVTRAYERAWRFVGEQLRRYVGNEPLLNVVSEGY